MRTTLLVLAYLFCVSYSRRLQLAIETLQSDSKNGVRYQDMQQETNEDSKLEKRDQDSLKSLATGLVAVNPALASRLGDTPGVSTWPSAKQRTALSTDVAQMSSVQANSGVEPNMSFNGDTKSKMPTGIGLDASDPVHPYKRTLYIMRGVPGSGKSTVAHSILRRHLIANGISGPLDEIPSLSRQFLFSTDDFSSSINEESGAEKTVFDMKKIKHNHDLNKDRTKIAMELGVTPIIVDNTNTCKWEMRPYVELGQAYGYNIIIKDVMAMQPELTFDIIKARVAGRKDATGKDIPLASIEAMIKRYEKLPPTSDAALAQILQAEPPWHKPKAPAP